MSLRAVFLGNSRNVFSQRFYQALADTPCEVVGVVDVPAGQHASTNRSTDAEPGSYVAEAWRRRVPVFDPANPNVPDVVCGLGRLRPDLFLAVGYLHRLRAALLAVPRLLSANVHASLLPAYRGRSPVFWALRHGKRFSGLTVHAMDERLDTGDILYQVRVPTRQDDTVSSLYDRIVERGLTLVPALVADAARGALPRRPQPREGGSYFSAPTPEDYCVDWSRPAAELRRWVVATPGECYRDVAGRRVFFADASLAPSQKGATAGALLAVGNRACVVATGAGALRLNRVIVGQEGETTLAKFCERAGLGVGASLS
jgi:methionyl-tRNA formyltransferase